MEPSTALGGPGATAWSKPAPPSGAIPPAFPEAQGPPASLPPQGRKLAEQAGRTAEGLSWSPCTHTRTHTADQGSPAPTECPLPLHSLLTPKPQAQLCRLQGKEAPVLTLLQAPGGPYLDHPNTTRGTDPSCRGQSGHSPRPSAPSPRCTAQGPQEGGPRDGGGARATARHRRQAPSPARPGIKAGTVNRVPSASQTNSRACSPPL